MILDKAGQLHTETAWRQNFIRSRSVAKRRSDRLLCDVFFDGCGRKIYGRDWEKKFWVSSVAQNSSHSTMSHRFEMTPPQHILYSVRCSLQHHHFEQTAAAISICNWFLFCSGRHHVPCYLSCRALATTWALVTRSRLPRLTTASAVVAQILPSGSSTKIVHLSTRLCRLIRDAIAIEESHVSAADRHILHSN